MKTYKARRATKAFEKELTTWPTGKYVLQLFVAGATARSRQAVLRIRQLCEAEAEGNYDLEVIDIYQQSDRARANQIVATPTLIKHLPMPVRRFIGNLSNTMGLFVGSNVNTSSNTALRSPRGRLRTARHAEVTTPSDMRRNALSIPDSSTS